MQATTSNCTPTQHKFHAHPNRTIRSLHSRWSAACCAHPKRTVRSLSFQVFGCLLCRLHVRYHGCFSVCRACLPGLEFLFMGLVWLLCAFCVCPVWGQNSDVPKFDQTHTKPTPQQTARAHQTHTPPDQTRTKPSLNPHQTHTVSTPSPHQTHTTAVTTCTQNPHQAHTPADSI